MNMIYISPARTGRGLFAGKKFMKNRKIFKIKGKIFSADYIYKVGGKISDNSFRFGPNTYLSPTGELGDYLNHSCKPNCVVRKQGNSLYLFAINDIKVNEELTIDYSTIIGADDNWVMNCNCGSKRCRKIIRKYDSLPLEIRVAYESLNGVPKYILATLEN